MELFLGIVLLVMAVFLVVAVLMQHGKSHRLSGSIAGGAETFFGKSKGRAIDSVLSKITTVVAVIFVLTVIAMYVTQDTPVTNNNNSDIDINDIIGQINDNADNASDNENADSQPDENAGDEQPDESAGGEQSAEGENNPDTTEGSTPDDTGEVSE